MLDGLRHDVMVDPRAALHGDRLEALDPRRIELVPFMRDPCTHDVGLRSSLRPDCRLHTRRLADRDTDAPRCELDAQRIGDCLQRMLRRRVWTEKGQRAPASNGADQHNASPRAPKQWKARLQHGDLPDHVDLELAAELVERDELERRCNRYAGIVDEAVQLATNDLGRGRDRRGVRDVELERLDAVPAQPLGILLAPDATEDTPAGGDKPDSRRVPDPR